jgi:hypothetical protein
VGWRNLPTIRVGWRKYRNLFLFRIHTLLLYPSLSPHRQTDRRTDRETNIVVCLAGCAVVLCQFLVLAGNWHFFVVVGNFHYNRKKKIESSVWRVRDQLRPEKKTQLSVWRVRDNYYDRKKKRFSCLSLVAIIIFVLVQLELNLIQIH